MKSLSVRCGCCMNAFNYNVGSTTCPTCNSEICVDIEYEYTKVGEEAHPILMREARLMETLTAFTSRYYLKLLNLTGDHDKSMRILLKNEFRQTLLEDIVELRCSMSVPRVVVSAINNKGEHR